jgi:outer membrane protein
MFTKNRLFGLLLMLLAIVASGWSQQVSYTSNDVLTLDQAIALALRQNHSVRNAELEAEKSGDVLAANRTYRLPSMQLFSVAAVQLLKQEVSSLNTNNNVFNNSVFPGVGPFFSVAVPRRPTAVVAGLILQPLSQQYRIGLNIKQAKLSREAAREQLRLVKQSTIDSVKESYYGILQTQSALDSIQEAIISYRELERLTSEQVAQRVSLKSTILDL